MQMGEDFISLYNQKYEDRVLQPTYITHSPDSTLQEVYSRDINIIFGFFDSETARKVLCRVSYLNMVTSKVDIFHAVLTGMTFDVHMVYHRL